MPFTFAHPAIVLPLLNTRKRIFSASGLIIGSIIPDFESFIKWDEHKIYSHTWLGIFWFDLPLGIIVAFLFHGIVRNSFIYNLPAFIGDKFEVYTSFYWPAYFRKHFIIVIYSLLIGITSHLLWDAFTHLNLADPDATDSNIYWAGMRLYIFLQYSTSLIGLFIVAWYILKIPKARVQKTKHERMKYQITPSGGRKTNKTGFWILFMLIASITIILAIYLVDDPANVILLIHIAISGLLLSLIITPILSSLFDHRSLGR